jgi:hypothetical protein
MRTELGTTTCAGSALRGTLTGATGGASGSITALTFSRCSGVVSAARSLASSLNPVSIVLNGGAATVSNWALLLSIFAGVVTCLYQGTLTGTWTSPTSMVRVTNGALPLRTALTSGCWTIVDFSMTVFTSATISNP